MTETERSSDVREIVTRVMREHVGPYYDKAIGEGGVPRIDWYGLRHELVAALTTTQQPPSSDGVEVERVECVSYDNGHKEPADPIWRIEIEGYCADFETETAARNFASVIARTATVERLARDRDGWESTLRYCEE